MVTLAEILATQRAARARQGIHAWRDPRTNLIHLLHPGDNPAEGWRSIGRICPSCLLHHHPQPCGCTSTAPTGPEQGDQKP